MKKFIAIVIIIAAIIGIAFGVKSCNPRTKPLNEAEETSAFIKANSEFTCLLKNSPELSTNTEQSKEELNKIYAKHHFPTDDDQAMMDILNKYANNTEVINQITLASKSC